MNCKKERKKKEIFKKQKKLHHVEKSLTTIQQGKQEVILLSWNKWEKNAHITKTLTHRRATNLGAMLLTRYIWNILSKATSYVPEQ